MHGRSILVLNMFGIGDTIHSRAVLRVLKERGDHVAVETAWPELISDIADVCYLPMPHKLMSPVLSAQRANVERLADKYEKTPHDSHFDRVVKIWYTADSVRRIGLVRAMFEYSGIEAPKNPDFSFDFESRHNGAVIYRPLTARAWNAQDTRNPDAETYYNLFGPVNSGCVVSVADCRAGENIVSKDVRPTMSFHNGELQISEMVEAFSQASLVYCSPGFALPLALATGTPVICVFGAYDRSQNFYSPFDKKLYCGVDLDNPCDHFIANCGCDKTINLERAQAQIQEFLRGIRGN